MRVLVEFCVIFLLVLGIISVAYTLCAAFFVRRKIPAPRPTPVEYPGVTLLKPLHGDEPGLEDNLRSFLEQDYEGPVQIVFGTRTHTDTAAKSVENICAANPGRDIVFATDAGVEATNPKIANLLNMVRHARHDVLILSDSDIRVPRDYVRTIVAELEEENVGAVTCLYRGGPLGGIWSGLEAMQIDYNFLPNVVVGTSTGLTKPCFGSTIGLRAETLAKVGGFAVVSRFLADDYEIGRVVRQSGYSVKISSVIVEHTSSEKNLRGLYGHEARWTKTIRLLNPAGHAGSIITHPLPLAMIAALVPGLAVPGIVLAAAALISRFWLAWQVRAAIGTGSGPLWLLPARDILSFLVFLASFVGNSVYWQGTRYMTKADGVLAQQ